MIAALGATPVPSDLWQRHLWRQGDFGSDEGGAQADEPPLRRANCTGTEGPSGLCDSLLRETAHNLPRLRLLLPTWGQGLFLLWWA